MIKEQYLEVRRKAIQELMEEGIAKMDKADEEILELKQKIEELECEICRKQLIKDNARNDIRALLRFRVPYEEPKKDIRF